MADDDDAFAMHLGVMGSKLSFSERLKQARQLDALLEAFSDDPDDSGDDEWSVGAGAVAAALPRGTVEVAAARRPTPTLSAVNPPSTSSHSHLLAASSVPDATTSAAASAASTRVATACSASSRQSSSDPAHPLLLPLPSETCPDGAQVRSSTLLTHVLHRLVANSMHTPLALARRCGVCA